MSLIKFKIELQNIQTNFVVLKEIIEGTTLFFVAFANSKMKDCVKLRWKDNTWNFIPPSDQEVVFSILFDSAFSVNSNPFECTLEQNEMDRIGEEILKHFE